MSEFGDASNRVTFLKFHGGETVTTERYSCTEFRQKKSDELSGMMLFDLSTDQDENSNVDNTGMKKSTFASVINYIFRMPFKLHTLR